LGPIDIQLLDHERRPEPLGEIGLRAKTVIAVGSGKGGVGKSTIAAALAVGLSRAGSQVGLMDADVYGPSIPHMFGATGRPEITENKKIRPHISAGLKMMSMGLLVGPAEAVVWRGPMLHGAITQFLRDTEWGDLDYLIIDMPPGTGDVALSLSQVLPLTGAVVVCTPQDVALLDANKAIAMFQRVQIRILGIVENMSGFDCPNCGTTHEIFGKGGARARAEELGVPFLGAVPIQLSVRISGDEGHLEQLFDDHVTSKPLQHLCHQLAMSLSQSAIARPVTRSLPVL
jgi:ATP-binding protein involved in chromosome partitioning